MSRSLIIEKYRNIGITKPQKLVLNPVFDEDNQGGLVILIGPNNSGKSNILDSLDSYSKGSFKDRDYPINSSTKNVPNIWFETSTKKCDSSISKDIFCKERKTIEPVLESNFSKGISWKELCELSDEIYKCLPDWKIKWQNDFSKCTFFESELDSVRNIHDLINELKQNNVGVVDGKDRKLIESFIGSLFALLEIDHNKCYEKEIAEILSFRKRLSKSNNKYLKQFDFNKMKFTETIQQNDSFKIIRYYQDNITNRQLYETNHLPYVRNKSMVESKFFKNLFNIIDLQYKVLLDTYNTYSSKENISVLSKLSNKINLKLIPINKKFNELFFHNSEQYDFKIECNKSEINFIITKNNTPLNLDYQSTGFRWFFDLFFNLIASTDLSKGDILVIDEPGTNLHVSGLIELREFLREFAIKNGITIVISTHSPFLISLDHLDELRVITNNENNEVIIKNNFYAIDNEDSDVISPIKNALTVANHMILDQDKQLLFVEGITDYNYLILFRNLLGIKDLVFLPIRGLGKSTDPNIKEIRLDISKKLIGIRKYNAMLLVDGDGAGKDMQKTNSKSELKVITISEIIEKHKDIESLFHKDDLIRLGIMKNDKIEKNSSLSSMLKSMNHKIEDFNPKTIENFKNLFNYITE
ncbi:MAG: ATP-dependent nuclease [Mycoplasma sp.]